MKLRAEHLKKTYRNRCVVNDVSLEVNQGEIIGLLGPNGAGKTTSFYMIVGLIQANGGQVFLDDTEITSFPMYKRAQYGVGYLAQENSVFRKLTVEQNILSVLQMTRLTPAQQLDKMNSLIDYYIKYRHISKEVVAQAFSAGLSDRVEAVSDKDTIVFGNNGIAVRARTVNQRRLVELYENNDLLFAVGPAGSGKTYTAIALAVRALKDREVRRVILTRPAVEAGEKLGFLPGDMKEKLDPYLQPLYDALNDMIPAAKLQKYIEEGTVQIAPLAYMRGRTLDNAFVILDEAQNTTVAQIKMFLTRMGRNAKFIVTGDVTQIDLPHKSDSGLTRAMETLRGIEGIGIVEFDRRDIVRHHLVKYIVEAFDRRDRLAEEIEGKISDRKDRGERRRRDDGGAGSDAGTARDETSDKG